MQSTHPEFTEDNTSFLQLWRDTVTHLYPTAESTAGWITPDTLTADTLHRQSVGLLSIDSAKSAKQLKQQLGGLDELKAGTILFLMDFQCVPDQIKLVYGCLRRRHLLPVYVSFGAEHWAFVVTESFTLNDTTLYRDCAAEIAADMDQKLPLLDQQIEADLAYLSGLTNEAVITDQFRVERERLLETMKEQLRRRAPNEWWGLAFI